MHQSNPSILILGLEPALAAELGRVLRAAQHPVRSVGVSSNPADCQNFLARHSVDLVFCASERSCFQTVLEAVAQETPGVPVIVVSRCPEVSEWLDAMEQGASDYCASPFEPPLLSWLLDSNLRRRRAAA